MWSLRPVDIQRLRRAPSYSACTAPICGVCACALTPRTPPPPPPAPARTPACCRCCCMGRRQCRFAFALGVGVALLPLALALPPLLPIRIVVVVALTIFTRRRRLLFPALVPCRAASAAPAPPFRAHPAPVTHHAPRCQTTRTFASPEPNSSKPSPMSAASTSSASPR
ncbi:hypothetical protein C8J57DRAFT_1385841 [Mycena rebaudengoi]|nr:hypothetical protein C8J57DRAFT_1385841 [Mycena rebaudengoi]